MQKALVLIATVAIAGTQAFTPDARQRLQNDFIVSTIEMEEIRAKHGMRPLQYSHWKESLESEKLESGHQVEECSIDIF